MPRAKRRQSFRPGPDQAGVDERNRERVGNGSSPDARLRKQSLSASGEAEDKTGPTEACGSRGGSAPGAFPRVKAAAGIGPGDPELCPRPRSAGSEPGIIWLLNFQAGRQGEESGRDDPRMVDLNVMQLLGNYLYTFSSGELEPTHGRLLKSPLVGMHTSQATIHDWVSI